jgi:protoheme IX farnesyltransferase
MTLTPFTHRFADYWALLKPRVMSLVVFTAVTGLLLAPGHITPYIGIVAIFSIAIGAGAAGAINMWYERDIDALMRRTIQRPLPAGRLYPAEALVLGSVLSVAAIVTLGILVNETAAVLLAVTIGYYVFIYTVWLKRRTSQNVVIGGVAGALPPVVGWTAVTGSIDTGAIFLFGVILLWTPPHSWALALFRQDDYTAAGVPMLPVVAGRSATGRQILVYTALLIPVTLLPLPLGMSGLLYEAAAIGLGIGFVTHAWSLYKELANSDLSPSEPVTARKMFVYSVRYLFLLFLALLLDRGLIIALS